MDDPGGLDEGRLSLLLHPFITISGADTGRSEGYPVGSGSGSQADRWRCQPRRVDQPISKGLNEATGLFDGSGL